MDTFTGFKFWFGIRGFLSAQDGLERGIGGLEGRDRDGQGEGLKSAGQYRAGKLWV